jgi:hypothetical protein
MRGLPTDDRINLIYGDIHDADPIDTDFTPDIGDYTGTLSFDDLDAFDPTEHYEQMAVGVLRSDAGRHYESDGFDRDTLREICHDLERDGHDRGGIIVPHLDVFDGDRLVHKRESTATMGVQFHGWPAAPTATARVLEDEAFVFGKRALIRPDHAPTEILVRHPDGVAHYEW